MKHAKFGYHYIWIYPVIGWLILSDAIMQYIRKSKRKQTPELERLKKLGGIK
jgi:hypothetical protein